jgi:hypothetical protein
MATPPVPPWRQLDNFSRPAHQRLVEKLNAQDRLDLEDSQRRKLWTRVGVITTAGPNGESDFTEDANWHGRYWVALVYSEPLSGGATEQSDAIKFTPEVAATGQPHIVCATNLAEISSDTKGLGPGEYVNVIAIEQRQPDAAAIVFEFDKFPPAGGTREIFRYKVTVAPTVANPSIVSAKLFDGTTTSGSDIVIACVIGHDVDNELWASAPVGGVDHLSAVWREVGVLGQEFEVELEVDSGTGTLADPYLYIAKAGGTAISAATNYTDRNKFLMTATEPATLGRGRFFPASRAFELVSAQEQFSPLVPCAVSTASTIPGTTVTYTVTDLITGATLLTGQTPPNRPTTGVRITTAATFGWGYHASDGTFSLAAVANEKYGNTTC